MSLMLKHQRTIKDKPAETALSSGHALGPAAAGLIGRQQLGTLLDNALAEDLRRLKAIKSIERKVAVKREQLVPKYRDYVARLRTGGQPHDLVGYFLVWLLDAGEIEEAMELGFYCVEAGINLPERFNRDLPTFLADAVLEWSEAAFEAGRSPEPYFSALFARVAGSDDQAPWDLPDALRGKYFRLRGLLDEKNNDIEPAVRHLERAMELGAKVKTKLADLQRLKDRGE